MCSPPTSVTDVTNVSMRIWKFPQLLKTSIVYSLSEKIKSSIANYRWSISVLLCLSKIFVCWGKYLVLVFVFFPLIRWRCWKILSYFAYFLCVIYLDRKSICFSDQDLDNSTLLFVRKFILFGIYFIHFSPWLFHFSSCFFFIVYPVFSIARFHFFDVTKLV